MVELGLEMAGLRLLDSDGLLAQHFLVRRTVERRQNVAALDRGSLGQHGENRRRRRRVAPAMFSSSQRTIVLFELSRRPGAFNTGFRSVRLTFLKK